MNKITRTFVLAVTTGLGAGYSPIAPGTAGSLLASVLLWYFQPSLEWIIGLAVLLFLLGGWASDRASQVFKKVDASPIVVDEIVGVLITMIGIPLTNFGLVVGFFLFRLFDILKPPPASYFDSKVKNGWGVMLDDVIAGIYANGVLQIILYIQK